MNNGLFRMLQACDCIKYGLEGAVGSDAKTLNIALGRLLDTMRDERTYDQSLITPYVLWLTDYRVKSCTREIRGDPYAVSDITMVHEP